MPGNIPRRGTLHHQRHTADLSPPRFEVVAHDSGSFGRNGFSDFILRRFPRLAEKQPRREQGQRDDDRLVPAEYVVIVSNLKPHNPVARQHARQHQRHHADLSSQWFSG